MKLRMRIIKNYLYNEKEELDKKNEEWESLKYDLNEDTFFHKIDKYQEKLKLFYKEIRSSKI